MPTAPIRATCLGALTALVTLTSACHSDIIVLPADQVAVISAPEPIQLVVLAALPHDTLASLSADGATLSFIKVRANAPPPALVGLTTTGGVFTTTSQTSATATLIGDTAAIPLQAPKDTGTLIVSASVAGQLTSDTIHVGWAYAQQLTLIPDSLSISDTAGVRKITASATRHPGFVTRGTPITFSVPFGSIVAPPVTDSTGTAVALYTLVGDNGAHSGTVTITATSGPVPAVAGESVPASLTLTIVPPVAPILAVSSDSAALNAAVGGAAAVTDSIQITNAGTGSLSGLTVGPIAYAASQPSGWLRAVIVFGATGNLATNAAAPAMLMLTATSGPLPHGTYRATVSLSATSAAHQPVTTIVVTFNVN